MGIAAWALVVSVIALVVSGASIAASIYLARARQRFELEVARQKALDDSYNRILLAGNEVLQTGVHAADQSTYDRLDDFFSVLTRENLTPGSTLVGPRQLMTEVQDLRYRVSVVKPEFLAGAQFVNLEDDQVTTISMAQDIRIAVMKVLADALEARSGRTQTRQIGR